MTTNNTVAKLELIPLDKISSNPANPRGAQWRDNDDLFESLRRSIRQFGILVPLVVTPEGDGYKLIDGERRWYVAKTIGMTSPVPAYVVSADIGAAETQSMMFHIHMNRLQWTAAQQCRASEELYAKLKALHPDDDRALRKEYLAETGGDSRTSRNRLQFLRWPPDIKQRVYDELPTAYWYVIEIEDKIVEPAQKNYPEYFEKVEVNAVRKFLFEKYLAGMVTASVEVREAGPIAKSNFTNQDDRDRVIEILDTLVRQKDYSFSDARDRFGESFPGVLGPDLPSPQKMLNSLRKLSTQLVGYDAAAILASPTRGSRSIDRDEFIEALDYLREAVIELHDELSNA